MTDKIAIVGLVIGLLSGVAVPVGLAMLERGAKSGATAPAAGNDAAPETSGAVASTAPPTSGSTDDPSSGGSAAPSPTFDGETLELAEDSYADLDSGKVDDDELFRREADIMLRSLDLAGARVWDFHSTVRMAVLADGDGGPHACAGATRFTRLVSDQKMRVGTQLCVRSSEGKMFLLRIESIPTYKTTPPAITLEVAEVPYDPTAAQFSTTLDLAEDYFVDLDGRKVDDDELFRREADIGLRSLDLNDAGVWDFNSTVSMTIADDVASPAACAKATKKTTTVTDLDMRVGTKVCVRSTRGRMFLLQVEQIPTYNTQPPVLVLRVA